VILDDLELLELLLVGIFQLSKLRLDHYPHLLEPVSAVAIPVDPDVDLDRMTVDLRLDPAHDGPADGVGVEDDRTHVVHRQAGGIENFPIIALAVLSSRETGVDETGRCQGEAAKR